MEKINELYKMCDKDELWLKRILNNERGLTTYDLLMEKQNTIDKLEGELKVAVEKQDFEEAIKLRDKIKELKS
jgi:excinuclease UvrABC helicase subunit UvrB